MHKEWGDIFPGLQEPVTGSCDVYHTTAQSARNMQTTTAELGQQFALISAGETVLKGSSATALTTVVKQVDNSFDALPGVFSQLARIFADHESQLRNLKQQAATALAKANTGWNNRQTAQAQLDDSRRAFAAIQQQVEIAKQQAIVNPKAASGIELLTSQQAKQSDNTNQAKIAVEKAEAELELARADHTRLLNAEAALTTQTSTAIVNLCLPTLEDVNALLDLLNRAADWADQKMTQILTAVGEFVLAIIHGRWAEVLWRLSEFLDGVLEVLFVIVLICCVIAIICCPALAVVAVLLLKAMWVLSIAKLCVDATLYGFKIEHPTIKGKKMDIGTVALDVLGVVGSPLAKGAGLVVGKIPVRVVERVASKVTPQGRAALAFLQRVDERIRFNTNTVDTYGPLKVPAFAVKTARQVGKSAAGTKEVAEAMGVKAADNVSRWGAASVAVRNKTHEAAAAWLKGAATTTEQAVDATLESISDVAGDQLADWITGKLPQLAP